MGRTPVRWAKSWRACWLLRWYNCPPCGCWPGSRWPSSASWAALGASVLLGLFGELLQLEEWMLDLSPFTHIPDLPGGEVSAEPLVWLVGVAAMLTIAGLVGFRRRDVG